MDEVVRILSCTEKVLSSTDILEVVFSGIYLCRFPVKVHFLNFAERNLPIADPRDYHCYFGIFDLPREHLFVFTSVNNSNIISYRLKVGIRVFIWLTSH